MKFKPARKSANRLDNILNVMLIVLALGAIGLGAWEVESDPATVASNSQQRA